MNAELSIVSYGVHIGIRVNDPKILEGLVDYLPPIDKMSSPAVVDEWYSFIVSDFQEEFCYKLYRAKEKLIETSKLAEALDTFDSDVRLQIAIAAQDKLFVHAGVVGWHDQAIVIPGRSFSGKTTLVASLVKAGATYYSDEYAVLDLDGWVHPYPRPLSIRQAEGVRIRRCPVGELSGRVGTDPLPIGLIVHTQYQPGAKWKPIQISSGQAMLALLDNTVVARLRPSFALPILANAVSSALSIEGQRSSADEVTDALLQRLKV